MSVRILDILASRPDGMRFSEIQEAIWNMNHSVPFSKAQRGHWCTNLLGGMHYHRGLLRFFASKGKDGRWRRNARPHHGHPWTILRDPQAHGFKLNKGEPQFYPSFLGYR